MREGACAPCSGVQRRHSALSAGSWAPCISHSYHIALWAIRALPRGPQMTQSRHEHPAERPPEPPFPPPPARATGGGSQPSCSHPGQDTQWVVLKLCRKEKYLQQYRERHARLGETCTSPCLAAVPLTNMSCHYKLALADSSQLASTGLRRQSSERRTAASTSRRSTAAAGAAEGRGDSVVPAVAPRLRAGCSRRSKAAIASSSSRWSMMSSCWAAIAASSGALGSPLQPATRHVGLV